MCISKKNDITVRRCTDVGWLVLFLLFFLLLVLVSSFAIVMGDSRQLLYGVDSFGNVCGSQNEKIADMSFTGMDMTKKPYLFVLDPANVEKSLKICVEKCPDVNLRSDVDIFEFYNTTGTNLCLYTHELIRAQYMGFSLEKKTLAKESVDLHGPLGPCPRLPVYESSSILNRCVPRSNAAADTLYKVYAYLNEMDILHQLTSDIYASWKEILYLTCLAAWVSLVLLLLLHLLVRAVGGIIFAVSGLASIAVTVYLWVTYKGIKDKLDETPANQLLEEEANNEEAFLLYSVVATFGTIILLLLLFAMRKRLRIAGSLFREASLCMRQIHFIFIQPLVTFVLLLLFFCGWFYVAVCLTTATKPTVTLMQNDFESLLSENDTTMFTTIGAESTSPNSFFKKYTVIEYLTPRTVRYFWWMLLVSLIWIPQIILAAQQFVISATVAQWYFTRDRETLRHPICRSIGWLFFYHMGSIACGSLLITVFKIPRLLITWLQNRITRCGDDSCRASCSKTCCCCFWLLEKFLRYMNHNAYTVVAIEGTSFCTSSKIAFSTLASNALQIATINSVGDFVLFLGKIFTTSVVCFVGLAVLQQREQLYLYAAPLAISCLFAYFVSHCILSLFEMVVDTLLLCYCEDTRMLNEGESEAPFTPTSLQAFIRAEAKKAPPQRDTELDISLPSAQKYVRVETKKSPPPKVEKIKMEEAPSPVREKLETEV